MSEHLSVMLPEVLEADRAQRATPWWFGPNLTHADIMVACALRFVREAHGAVFDLKAWPALLNHADRCEALPPFQAHQQAFFLTPPKKD